MSVSKNKDLYQRYIDECFNAGRVDLLDQLLAPSYVFHEPPPGLAPGMEGVRQTIHMFHAAFPDMKITIDEMVAEGDKVCARATTRGTHTGQPIMGIPASGKKFVMRGMTMVRIVDGRITDSWVSNDVLGLQNQLRG